MMEINSLTNTKVKKWIRYKEKKYRDSDGKFLVEGEHLLEEAYHAGLLETIVMVKNYVLNDCFSDIETYIVSDEIMNKLSFHVSKEKVMGICNFPIEKGLGNRIILLDGVQDPGNVGTIIRSALSFGFDSVVLSKQSADIYNDKVIRSTQGAMFHIPVYRKDILEVIHKLKEKNIPIHVTSLTNASPLKQVKKPESVALVFGNEGKGVSKEVIDLADECVYIEMDTFESLNVAVAAGICMYEYKK